MKKKKARLLFAQVDHVSGEVTGFAIGRIMELGARNVQLVSSITKKNRPGNIIIIDTDDAKEGVIARFLARELKVSGYHRIDTLHVFQQITFQQRDLEVAVKGKKRTIRCEVKIVGDLSRPLSFDVEHDALVTMQKFLKGQNRDLSLSELRTAIESKLRTSKKTITLDI
ncbi:MAG TPA: nickel insertion protein [Nitrospirota bacterium]|nr:nickel insertion protein [Nitrospirota bacterium]